MMTTTTEPIALDDEEAALAALRRDLAARAADDGVLDVTYRVIDSPIGRLLVAATPHGLVRLAFENEPVDDVLEELATKLSPRILESHERLDAVATQFDEYFKRERSRFDLPIDWSLSRGYRREVLDHLTRIPFGATESYTEVAAATGNPLAVRAVGSACATNPVPLVIPCHRVLRSDGSLGGYRGGLDAKRQLLDLEAAA